MITRCIYQWQMWDEKLVEQATQKEVAMVCTQQGVEDFLRTKEGLQLKMTKLNEFMPKQTMQVIKANDAFSIYKFSAPKVMVIEENQKPNVGLKFIGA